MNPNNNDTLFFLDYENNYPILLYEPFDNLIYANELNKDGEFIIYAHTPPFLSLETHIVHRDLTGKEYKRDTILGNSIKTVLNTPSENLITVFAIDTGGYAVMEESFLFVSKRNNFKNHGINYKPWFFLDYEDIP